MKRVILESPYAGNDKHTTDDHVAYARMCMADCLHRGEAPYASHLLYTQPGVLDDDVPGERRLGMDAGFAWRAVCGTTVIYVDRGMSRGMVEGYWDAVRAGHTLVFRTLWTGRLGVKHIERAYAAITPNAVRV